MEERNLQLLSSPRSLKKKKKLFTWFKKKTLNTILATPIILLAHVMRSCNLFMQFICMFVAFSIKTH